MTGSAISTPCVKVCVIDPISALCIGCGRSSAEIAAWRTLSEDERLAIMADLPDRLVAQRARAARGGQAGGARR